MTDIKPLSGILGGLGGGTAGGTGGGSGGILSSLFQNGSGTSADPLQNLLNILFPNRNQNQQTPAPTGTTPPPAGQPTQNPTSMTPVISQLMRAYPQDVAMQLGGGFRPPQPQPQPQVPAPNTPPTPAPPMPTPGPYGAPQGGGGIQWPLPWMNANWNGEQGQQAPQQPSGPGGGGILGIFGGGGAPPNPAQNLINNRIFPMLAARG